MKITLLSSGLKGLNLTMLTFFCINYGDQRKIIINDLMLALSKYLCYWSTAVRDIFNSFSEGTIFTLRNLTQILTCKDSPRAERDNVGPALVDQNQYIIKICFVFQYG